MKFGFDCVISRNTGTYGSPTWNPVELCRDAALNTDANEADVTTRGANGWDQAEPSTKKAELVFTLLHDNSNGDFTAFRDAYLNRTALDLAVLDGAANATGSQGLRAQWKVFGFRRLENLRDAVAYEVVCKPCLDVTNPPVWMTVA